MSKKKDRIRQKSKKERWRERWQRQEKKIEKMKKEHISKPETMYLME